VDEADSAAMQCHSNLSEPVTESQNNVIKIGDHGRSKCQAMKVHKLQVYTVLKLVNKVWYNKLYVEKRRWGITERWVVLPHHMNM
jgi:hypothetical protein